MCWESDSSEINVAVLPSSLSCNKPKLSQASVIACTPVPYYHKQTSIDHHHVKFEQLPIIREEGGMISLMGCVHAMSNESGNQVSIQNKGSYIFPTLNPILLLVSRMKIVLENNRTLTKCVTSRWF